MTQAGEHEFYRDQRVTVTATFYDGAGRRETITREARIAEVSPDDGSGYDGLTLILPAAR